MLTLVLVVLAAVFLVLGFVHAIGLLTAVALALVCVVAAFILGGVFRVPR